MALRFLGRTTLGDLDTLSLNGRRVTDQHPRLEELARADGLQLAGLFAQPWRGSEQPDAIAWYTEATGDPESLVAASADRRPQIEALLRAALAALAPRLDDPADGALLRHALMLANLDGVFAVDGRIVLTGWGLAPAGMALPPDVVSASPLAPYLPLPDRRRTALPPRAAAATAATAEAAAVRGVPVVRTERSVWNWWLLPAAIAVASVFLTLGLWLGARAVAARLLDRPTEVALFDEGPVRAALDRQRQMNQALQAQIEERRQSLGGEVCTPDPSRLPPLGPDRSGAVAPEAIPAVPGAPPFRGTLADLLTQGVVMVLAGQNDGLSTGSGFFVAPGIVVTNRHVVEHAAPGKLFVTGGKLGRAAPAELVSESDGDEIGSLDVAVLRVRDVAGVQPLVLATAAAPLDQVIAAGYPGLTLEADAAYHRLIEGDASAVPQVILTDGRINAIQTSSAGLKIMPHTAAIAPGNSGGPLADACGRVIGINTFINVDAEHAAQTRYAQKIDAIADFLKSKGIPVTVVGDSCAAGGGPSVTPAATPPAATPLVPAAAAPVPPAPPAAAH